MESQNNLETNGSLQINSFAELLAEIRQFNLNGALRLAHEAQKIVVYFDAGAAVFAVSNARRHRIFERLLQAGQISQEQMAQIPQYTNDLALRDYLIENKTLAKPELDAIFSEQIADIAAAAIEWHTGDWTFNPLVRFKGAMHFSVNLRNALLTHARGLPPETIERKLIDPQTAFGANARTLAGTDWSPRDSFVFSRFETANLTLEEIQTISGLPGAEVRQIIYALWLGGALERVNWHAAFSERKIAAIGAARISLKKEEAVSTAAPEVLPTPIETNAPPNQTAETAKPETVEVAAEKLISLEDYLTRTENAASFYEIFAVSPIAEASEIKQIYFGLAKRFHPDLYHKNADAILLQRVQTAFTKLAHAYDTLKTVEARDLYDFKMRKELAQVKAAEAAGATGEEIGAAQRQDRAAENFERGFALLTDGNSLAAIPFLARAVHFAKNDARCHAFYGKALAADAKHRHKAESELQTAVKLDSNNAVYRIMLAEFFIEYNLLKRAEGELNRLLAIHPNHRQARSLLDSLPKK